MGTIIPTDRRKKRCLITGGAGFIGSHLADALVARGDEVVILDDLSTGRVENIEHLVDEGLAEFIEGSTLDPDVVKECMGSVDACFHLASAVGVQLIVQRPLDSLLRNIRGNDIVISLAAEHRTRLVFTSTSEIYGKNNDGMLSEASDRILGSPSKSRWAYSTAKAVAEAMTHAYHRERDLPASVVRLFNTSGPRQSSAYGMVVPRFVRQALVGEDLTVYGNGTQSRCFIHVHDTVQAILAVADSDAAIGRVFNVGNALEVPIVELARKVIERSGSSSKVRLIPYDEAYEEGFEELGRRVPDTTALEALSGWRPTRSLDEIIDDVIERERAAMSRARGKLRLVG